jgi:predicted DNA-binding helix-hairpin-helix protein
MLSELESSFVEADHRLAVLADASRFDVSCACGKRGGADHRRRGRDGLWVYPASIPGGGTSVMLKTLLSNACVNDCRYCPFRAGRDFARTTLTPQQVAEAFMAYLRGGQVFGLFLSSGVIGSPDATMDRLVAVGDLLRRRHAFTGYLHMKVIPGASDAAIEAALDVADCVSLNVEAPTRAAFRKLSSSKDFERDIVRPVHLISRLTAKGSRHEGVCQMTQFVVGAADETDRQVVEATGGLYGRLGLRRVYFSAYQRGLGEPGLPGERAGAPAGPDLLTREHRLYQADFLLRRYGFEAGEIPFEPGGNLSLDVDPKELWARRHPERFPVVVNRAGRWDLLRVPGLGPVTVRRIMERRRQARLTSIEDVGCPGKRLRLAEGYLDFGSSLSSSAAARRRIGSASRAIRQQDAS